MLVYVDTDRFGSIHDTPMEEIYERGLIDAFDSFILKEGFARSTYRNDGSRICCYPCRRCGESLPHDTLRANTTPDIYDGIAALFLSTVS